MKANTKYTALEILKEARVPGAEKAFGKVRIRIAGIHGIVKPDHLIRFQPDAKRVEIVVGADSYELKLEKGGKNAHFSDEAVIALEAKGEESTRKSEELQKAKAEARKAKQKE